MVRLDRQKLSPDGVDRRAAPWSNEQILQIPPVLITKPWAPSNLVASTTRSARKTDLSYCYMTPAT